MTRRSTRRPLGHRGSHERRPGLCREHLGDRDQACAGQAVGARRPGRGHRRGRLRCPSDHRPRRRASWFAAGAPPRSLRPDARRAGGSRRRDRGQPRYRLPGLRDGRAHRLRGDPMEFTDVVMKRRAVRRFEEGGVDREVIERIARLAQRTPSAGFSQGQRLIVVTDPAAVARSPGSAARRRTRRTSGRGSASAPPSSSRASARRSTTAATRRRTRSMTTARRSTGRSPTGGSTSARRCRTSCWPP